MGNNHGCGKIGSPHEQKLKSSQKQQDGKLSQTEKLRVYRKRQHFLKSFVGALRLGKQYGADDKGSREHKPGKAQVALDEEVVFRGNSGCFKVYICV